MELDRRDFLKSTAAALGATAMAEGLASVASAATPVYEVYALKYAGPFTSKLALLLWLQGWDETIDRYYYVWALKGKDETVVVDTGVGVTLAAQRKLTGYVNPVDVLARIGVTGDNVTKVVITHMHFDHVGGIEMFPKAFPKATFYVQKKEFDFWTKHPVSQRKVFAATADPLAIKALADLEGTERLVTIRGNRQLLPGIELVLAPGHTIGLQSVAVNTAKGTAIVASDCAHIARNIKEDTPSALITDMIGWMESYDRLRARAASLDLIFPGHDAGLLLNYPKVAEDVTRLA